MIALGIRAWLLREKRDRAETEGEKDRREFSSSAHAHMLTPFDAPSRGCFAIESSREPTGESMIGDIEICSKPLRRLRLRRVPI